MPAWTILFQGSSTVLLRFRSENSVKHLILELYSVLLKVLAVDSFYVFLIYSLRLKHLSFLIRIASICGKQLNRSASVMQRATGAFGARELLCLLLISPFCELVISCWRFWLDRKFVIAIAVVGSFCHLMTWRLSYELFQRLTWILLLTNDGNVRRRRRQSFATILRVLHILLNHLKSFIVFIKIQLSFVNSVVSNLFW